MGDYNQMINIIFSIISNSNDISLIESIVFFDYDNKIINFDNSHIKDIEFIKNDKLDYYDLFELYYNKLFENDNNKIIKKTNKSYSKILTNTKQWINKMDESIYPIIINNIAKNMKSLIEINFKDDINDYNDNKNNINTILCFLDYILIITSKNHNLYSFLNKYFDIICVKYSTDDFDNSYKLNIKQLKLLFTI